MGGDDAPTEELIAGERSEPRVVEHPRPAVGERVAERYELLAVLGSGAFGTVYKAYDHEMRETLALKFLGAASSLQREELRREVRAARSVSHPGVVRIFDLVVDGERTALSMELVEGPTLEALLDEAGGHLDAPSVEALARDLALALGAIHDAGIVHRDLKPSNVMFRRGAPVIMDFGICSEEAIRAPRGDGEPLGPVAKLLGTPLYMAPEHLEGRALTPATDLYALGLVLYEAASGELPHSPAPAADLTTLWKLRMEPPPPLPPGAAPVAPALDAAIARCLDPRPERRFPSATAFLAAWDDENRGPRPPPRGRRRLLALGAFAAILAVAVPWIAAHRAHVRPSWAVPAGAPRVVPATTPEPPAGVPLLPDTGRPHVVLLGVSSGNDALGVALEALWRAELLTMDGVTTVTEQRAQRLRADLPAALSRSPDDALRAHTPAHVYLGGEVRSKDEQFLVRVTAHDFAGVRRAESEAQGASAFDALERAVTELRRRLGWAPATAADAAAARAVLPSREDQAMRFASAMVHLRAGERDAARRLLEEVAGEQPDHAVTLAHLATLHAAGGDLARAAARWGQAEAGLTAVPTALGAELRAARWEAEGRGEDAVRAFRPVLDADPSSSTKRLRFATLLLGAGRPAEARRVLGEAVVPRWDTAGLTELRLLTCRAWRAEGHAAEATRAAEEALALAEARGAKSDAADARACGASSP